MNSHIRWQLLGLASLLVSLQYLSDAYACCAVSRVRTDAIAKKGIVNPQPVVNADQEVIMIWDAARKTQHFIRRASFKSTGDDDLGFLIPSPSKPILSESGNQAFPYLAKVTAPEIIRIASAGAMGGTGGRAVRKSATKSLSPPPKPPVRVLEEKLVAGFNAVVLEADSADALVNWLKENQFVYSPEVAAWAKPYIEQKWKITALKVAKDRNDKNAVGQSVKAAALRMTFHTDRPLFPYREPDSTKFAESLGARQRILRIYFIAEGRYRGDLTPETPWTGNVVWSGKMNPIQKKETLKHLKLQSKIGPDDWWLTEFEDSWPYKVAPADLYFSRSDNQAPVKRPPVIEYVSNPSPKHPSPMQKSPQLTADNR